MKKFTNWFFKNAPARGDSLNFAITFLRIYAGLAMIPYGWSKVQSYDKLKESFFGDPVCLGDEPSLILCIFQQIFCALMLVFGVQSRFAAFMLFTNMAVAVKFHFFDPYCAVKALPTLFLAIYAFLVVSGGGKFSVDNLIFKNHQSKSPRNYAPRVIAMAVAFCMAWILWGGVFALSGAACAAALAATFAIFLFAVFASSPYSRR